MPLKRIMCALALAALVQGCVSPAPRFERHFGEAVRANVAAQVARPNAAVSTDPAAGIDGKAARAAQERYEKSFTQSEPPSTKFQITSAGR
jgi:type IV pilus biogenesis protein CpaD/CtpE